MVSIDFDNLEKLCQLQCTLEEVASFFECSVNTLKNRIRDEFGLTWEEYYRLKQGKGKIALRRLQFQAAEKGNISMLIFLGKQYLGQSDKQDIKHDGTMTTKHERLLKHIRAQEIEDVTIKPKEIESESETRD